MLKLEIKINYKEGFLITITKKKKFKKKAKSKLQFSKSLKSILRISFLDCENLTNKLKFGEN